MLGLASCQVDDVSKMTNKLMLKEFLTQNSRKISDFQIDACSCCVYLTGALNSTVASKFEVRFLEK